VDTSAQSVRRRAGTLALRCRKSSHNWMVGGVWEDEKLIDRLRDTLSLSIRAPLTGKHLLPYTSGHCHRLGQNYSVQLSNEQ
jgi:hypothetical protein